MGQEIATRAELLNTLPSERYKIMLENTNPPKQGDIVTLDQAFTSDDGKAMVLIYCIDNEGTWRYEAEVYESELGQTFIK